MDVWDALNLFEIGFYESFSFSITFLFDLQNNWRKYKKLHFGLSVIWGCFVSISGKWLVEMKSRVFQNGV